MIPPSRLPTWVIGIAIPSATAMCEPMPILGFQWLTQNEIGTLDLLKIDDKDTEGYIVEVDLEYPESLHS